MASNCILLQSYGSYAYKKLEAQYCHEHADICLVLPLVEISATFGNKGFALSGEVVLEAELSKICESILSLLDCHLIPSANSSKSKVFYLKMKGDYHCYLAKFMTSAKKNKAAEKNLMAYKSAHNIVAVEFSQMHPICLGFALNFLNFYYDNFNLEQELVFLEITVFPRIIARLDVVLELWW
ncbi:hypothetical protein L7F22_037155 [Adiantum nelumboides]|nr:hypothetical protein [Adiantum nelumboides]